MHPRSHQNHHQDENQIMIASGELIMRQDGLFGRWKKFFFTLSKDGVLIKFKSSNFHTPLQRYLMVYSSSLQLERKMDNKKDASSSVITEQGQGGSVVLALDSTVVPSLPQPALHICGKENSLLLFVENSLGERETLLVVAPSDEQYVMWIRGFEIVYEHVKYELSKSHYQMPDFSTSSITSSSSLSIQSLLEHIPKSINFELFQKGLKISKLVEMMTDPTIIANEKGIILGVNNSAEVLFEWEHTELIGESVKVLMPSMFASHHDEYMAEYVKHRVKRMIGKPRNVVGKTKSGRVFAVEISLGEIDHNHHDEDFSEMAFMAVFRLVNPNVVWSDSLPTADTITQSNAEVVQQDEKDFNEILLASSGENKAKELIYNTVRGGHSQTNSPEDEDSEDSECSSDDNVIVEHLFVISGNVLENNFQSTAILQQLSEHKHKIGSRVEKFKHHLERSYEKEAKLLRTKVLLLSKQLEILEQENEKLFMQQESEREHIELLEREMTILFPSTHIFFLEMLTENSYRDAILNWSDRKDTCLYNQVRCCLRICEFKERFSTLSPRTTSEQGLKEMETQARLLFDEYFSLNAKYHVVIPKDIVQIISLRLETPTSHMFHIALHSIISDLIQHYWRDLSQNEILGKIF
nr:unnamed protein product [Naegleria fowleri]